MENEKNNTPKPVEADFFAEALKAFEVPSSPAAQPPAPKPKREEKVETAPIQPPKPTFWRKRWPAVLCCAVCAVLLLSFLPGLIKSQYRGENWVYGTLTAVNEDSLVLTDQSGTHWRVELDGLEAPQQAENGLWVFYNGHPEHYKSVAEDQYRCSKKITATTIRTARWYRSTEYDDYGLIADEIDFDLDGDGEKERWLFHKYDVHLGIDLPANRTYRLTALDAAGDLKYHAAFLPPASGSYIFSDQGGALSLISATPDQTLQIRLENGSISVYHGDTALNTGTSLPIESTPPTVSTQPLPPEPTISETSSYQIFFVLEQDTWEKSQWIYGERQATGEKQDIDPQAGADFKQCLDELLWTRPAAFSTYEFVGYFALFEGKTNSKYYFANDGRLYHNGEIATMDDKLRKAMIALMGFTPPESQYYYATDNNGGEAMLEFRQDGTFYFSYELPVSDGVYNYSREGVYGSIGNMLYLYMDGASWSIFVLEDQGNKLRFMEDLSRQYLMQLDDQAIFYTEDRWTISLRFYHSAVSSDWDRSHPAQILEKPLTREQMQKLKQLISELSFSEPEGKPRYNKIGGFTLYDESVETQFYYTADAMLIADDLVAPMSEELSSYLLSLMCTFSEKVEGQYMAENRDGEQVKLELYSENNQFLLTHPGGVQTPGSENGETWGAYVLLGDSLRLYTGSLCTEFIQLRIANNGDIIYVDKLTNTEADHRLRDGAVFQEVLDIFKAYIEWSAKADIIGNRNYLGARYIDFPENRILIASKMVNTLPWAKHYGEITYVHMGSIAFFDTQSTLFSAYVTSGKQLDRDGWTAKLSNDQWELVVQLMVCAGEGPMPGTYTADTPSGKLLLELQEDNRFSLSGFVTEGIVQSLDGYYVNAEGAVLFYGDDGQCFVMWERENGSLEFNIYNSDIQLWELPYGLTFLKSAEQE